MGNPCIGMVRSININTNLATALACDPNHLRLGMVRLAEGLVIRSLIERLELRTFEVVSMKPEGLRVNNCQGAGIGKLKCDLTTRIEIFSGDSMVRSFLLLFFCEGKPGDNCRQAFNP